MKGRSATIFSLEQSQPRREAAWAWLSLLTLVLCWDASARLDDRVSPPRVRIAHAGEREEKVAGHVDNHR